MEFKIQTTFKGHKAPIYALCAGESEDQFFSAGSDRHVVSWNINSPEAERIVANSPTTIISILYIKKHHLLLIGQVEGGVHIIDLSIGKEIKYLKIHKGYIFDIQYIEWKGEVVFSSGDGTISIWSVLDFKFLYQKKIGTGKNRKMSLSYERKELAIASGDNKIEILNTEDWTAKYVFDEFASAVNSACYFPNKGVILAGEKDAQLNLIDIEANKYLKKIPAHNWAIYNIKFSSNKKWFATASRDKTVKIWDAEKMAVLKRFEGAKDQAHTLSVNDLLWVENSNLLLSASDDKTIKLWEVNED